MRIFEAVLLEKFSQKRVEKKWEFLPLSGILRYDPFFLIGVEQKSAKDLREEFITFVECAIEESRSRLASAVSAVLHSKFPTHVRERKSVVQLLMLDPGKTVAR
jgi:hypothetical protein